MNTEKRVSGAELNNCKSSAVMPKMIMALQRYTQRLRLDHQANIASFLSGFAAGALSFLFTYNISHWLAIVAAATISVIQFVTVTLPLLLVWKFGGVTPPNWNSAKAGFGLALGGLA